MDHKGTNFIFLNNFENNLNLELNFHMNLYSKKTFNFVSQKVVLVRKDLRTYIRTYTTYSCKSAPNNGFFEKLFHLIVYFFFTRKLPRGSRWRIFFFHFPFWYLTWDLNPVLTSYKPISYARKFKNIIEAQHILF